MKISSEQLRSLQALEHLTPELLVALDELIDRAVTFGGDFAQVYVALSIEKRSVRQMNVLPFPGFSVRVPGSHATK